jgi:4'-phosphopantetheinyl transferase
VVSDDGGWRIADKSVKQVRSKRKGGERKLYTPRWMTPSGSSVEPIPGIIDLWLIDLDSAAPSVTDLLDKDERMRASRFVFSSDAQHFQAARGYLRLVLGKYLRCAPASIVFEYGQWGKPFLQAEAARHLAFNLAHSDGHALVAVGLTESLGVDIEAIRPFENWRDIAVSTFAPGEVKSLLALAQDTQLDGFFATWTRKEAIIKLRGEGLSADLKAFEVSTSPEPSDDLPRLIRPNSRLESIQLWTFRPTSRFWAAVAAPAAATDVKLRFWHLT